MVRVNVWVVVTALASVTAATNNAVPAVVGIPAIEPAEDMERPGGNVPAVSDQKYGEVPPVAAKVREYGTPTAPAGKGDELDIPSELMARVNVWLVVAEVESVTVTVNVEVTAAAARVPEIQVVAVGTAPAGPQPRERPAGNAPEVIAQAYGGTPPLAARFWL
jgi:hypothetical protein